MNPNIKMIMVVIASLIVSGCTMDPALLKEGWSSSQHDDLLEILRTDKYGSMCNLKSQYDKYLKTKDAKILNKLAFGYAQNLANSCIDISRFKLSQRSKNSRRIKTHFELNLQKANATKIMLSLRDGKDIEDILKPYIPTNPQFKRLLKEYHSLKNSSDKTRLRIVKLNLERTKLMRNLNWNNYVLINIPEFKFRLFENAKKSMEFDVIVGRKNWQTPIFDSVMKYVVLNPTWHVPDNIARSEYIPKLIKNPYALKRKNMIIEKVDGKSSKEVDPKSVNWKSYMTKAYKNKNIPFKIVQKSSTRNALGTVKFIFPNRFAVYMHDTQNKSLFKRKVRAYSHGCVRVSKPQELLKHIANNYTSTNYNNIKSGKNRRKTKYVNLGKNIPVQIAYFTAYVDESGSMHFFKDIYGYDSSMQLKGGAL